MRDILNFETTMEKKYAPSINFSWTRKPIKKKKLSREMQRLLDRLWREDGKENT